MGVWRAPLSLKARLSGATSNAEMQGSAEPWDAEPRASFNLSARGVSLAPLLDLKPTDTLAQRIDLSSRVSLKGDRLTFDDLDSSIAGSRLRGRVALSLNREKSVEGEVGLDALDLAPAFAAAIGAAGRDAAEPLGAGLFNGWRGRLAFQALRGMLPGGGELRPVSGLIKSDGQSVSFESIKGGLGGGETAASVDARQSPNGVAFNASLQLSGVDGSALRYRGLTMPSGRTSMQVALTSQGRSASALSGAISGSGTVTVESIRVAGLDPRVFDAAIRASDNGQATDDARLRQIIEPVLSAGALTRQVGANSVQLRRWPASCRRDHAGCETAPAPSFPADTTSQPIRPIFVPPLCRPRLVRQAAVPSFSCSWRVRPMRSIAPSMWRRYRPGWR